MFETSRTAAKPRRWISTMYPKYVNQIAGIYVRSEDINDRMSRETRGSTPEYSCTYDGIVSRCRGAECEAARKALRKIAADDGDMSRERHSVPTLRRGPDSLEATVAGHPAPCRRSFAAWRLAGVNEVVTMRRRFGACIIDPAWHVANRFRHVARPFRTILDPIRAKIMHEHARSCTFGLWFPFTPWKRRKSCIFELWFPFTP